MIKVKNEAGNATAFTLNGNMYFYVKNLQGDIINIVDSNGAVVVRYDYDVFGKIVSTTDTSNISLSTLNPFRYRGYVYDDETGLYYLQSRYYDPVTGRFINADIYADTGSGSTLGTNVFSYCMNNPSYRIDKSGKDAVWVQAPDSAPFWFFKNGHTSVIFKQGSNYWYFFIGAVKAFNLFFFPQLHCVS